MKKEIFLPEDRPQFPLLILLPEIIATDTLRPRTVDEWNRLPATIREIPYVDTFIANLYSIEFSIHVTRNIIN